MRFVQIIMIWGAAQAALFSFPSQVQAGEWENYQDLKAAIVRSSARRDVPLPPWAGNLDYKRPYHFWDVQPVVNKPEKIDVPSKTIAPMAQPSVPVLDVQSGVR